MIPAQAQAGEVNSAAFSPDGRTLLTASDDGKLRLWNLATCSVQATIPAHKDDALARFAPDGRRLISAGRRDGLVRLWDQATFGPVVSIKASARSFRERCVLARRDNFGHRRRGWIRQALEPC